MIYLMTAPDVLQPVREVGKISRTVVALVRSQSRVDVTMLAELRAAEKPFVTFATHKRPFRGVYGRMHLQAAFRFVAFTTELTPKGSLLRMMIQVPLQVRLFAKRFLTLLALVRSQTDVGFMVLHQIYLLHKRSATLAARKRRRIRMDFAVRVDAAS